MRSHVITLLLPLLVSGCATRKYVTREVGDVNHKVETLSSEVETT